MTPLPTENITLKVDAEAAKIFKILKSICTQAGIPRDIFLAAYEQT